MERLYFFVKRGHFNDYVAYIVKEEQCIIGAERANTLFELSSIVSDKYGDITRLFDGDENKVLIKFNRCIHEDKERAKYKKRKNRRF